MREREGRRQRDRYLMYTGRGRLDVQRKREKLVVLTWRLWFVVSLSIAKRSVSGSIFVMQQPSWHTEQNEHQVRKLGSQWKTRDPRFLQSWSHWNMPKWDTHISARSQLDPMISIGVPIQFCTIVPICLLCFRLWGTLTWSNNET